MPLSPVGTSRYVEYITGTVSLFLAPWHPSGLLGLRLKSYRRASSLVTRVLQVLRTLGTLPNLCFPHQSATLTGVCISKV